MHKCPASGTQRPMLNSADSTLTYVSDSSGTFTASLTMDACQRCWTLPELIAMIVKACVPPLAEDIHDVSPRIPSSKMRFDYLRGLGTVCALARTCRAVFHECLPVLWHTQHGIEPLLSCLPPHLWKKGPVRGRDHRILSMVSADFGSRAT